MQRQARWHPFSQVVAAHEPASQRRAARRPRRRRARPGLCAPPGQCQPCCTPTPPRRASGARRRGRGATRKDGSARARSAPCAPRATPPSTAAARRARSRPCACRGSSTTAMRARGGTRRATCPTRCAAQSIHEPKPTTGMHVGACCGGRCAARPGARAIALGWRMVYGRGPRAAQWALKRAARGARGAAAAWVGESNLRLKCVAAGAVLRALARVLSVSGGS